MNNKISLELSLEIARCACTPKACEYSERLCPTYWQRVFVLYFGSEPTGMTDPRWDELFKLGFEKYHKMLAETTEEAKAAS